jgi:hypothetical protein
MIPAEYSTTPATATGRGPSRSWSFPPSSEPTKIMPTATSNGSTTWDLLQPNSAWNGLLKTLQA